MTLTWTNGNGTRRIVVARQGSAVNANPVDLTSYAGNPIFGSGTQIGTGNYVVFSSTSNTVNVTGLQPNTIYHYSIFEFNGLSGPVYLIPGATANATTLPRPTVAASNIIFSLLEGNSMRVNWTSGNGARRIVIAKAGSAVTAVPADGVDYNASAIFGSGDAIQPGEFVVYDNAGSFIDISNLLPNTVYHFRIYEYDGSGVTTAYLTTSFAASSQSTLTAPTTQASNISFTNLSGNSVTVNWTNGNGTRRLVVARAGSAVNANPVDLTFYGALAAFGSGAQIGTGNFVVYNNTGNSVTVTNLQINTTYHFAVYELNGNSGPVYLLPGALANVTTPAQPTVPASNMNFILIEGNSLRVQWTSGNGTRRIVVARAGSAVTAIPANGTGYNANAVFGSGDAILPGEFVVYDNTSNFVDITGLQPATTYHFRIYEYNGSGASAAYLTSLFASGSQATLSAPVTQASTVNFTNISGSTVRVNWTSGSGNGRIVVARQGSAVNADPVNGTAYTGNTIFGNGTQIGTGNFVVYRAAGAATFVTVTNLLPGTIYHFSVYEYNGSNGPVFLVPGATGNVVTAAQPTVASTNMNFNFIEGNSLRVNWTNGNGARRIVIARAGNVVTAIPVNGIDYNASAVFGSGDAPLAGQFVVYDNSSNFVDVSNLLPNTVYHFAVFEYDGTGAGTAYLTSSFLIGSQSTSTTPTTQASNVSFSSVAGTSVTVGWTNGNGTGRIVLARQGSAVNADPVNLQSYSPNSSFGSGTQIGVGNFVVFSSNGSSVNVTNLIGGTTYHFAVYEYNGSSGRVYAVPGATGNTTTLGPPQIQATAASAGTITATTMQLNWTNGSGNRRLVLMKQGTAVDANPVDNGTYNANSAFGSGTQLGTGNYTVFNGTTNTVLVTNLLPNTTYHFAVFEFNAFGANSQFLLTNPARGNATTQAVLPVTFIDFNARNDKNKILLEWSTAQEFNSSHFEIEKSSNGINFMVTGRLNAAGNSNDMRRYVFADDNPYEGTSYYRLKQVDFDSRFMYSRIVSVKYEPKGLIKKIVNPVKQNLFVQLTAFNANSNANNEWRLYDLQGHMLAGAKITSDIINVQLPSLPAAMYVLELRLGDKTERIKIIKE
jgi:hypothetical protein